MELQSTTDFVLTIRSKTEGELLREYPKLFHNIPNITDKNLIVQLMLANDAIKYRIIGEHAKFLKQDLTDEMFEGENKLFLNFKKIGSKHYENNRRVIIGIGFKNGIHKKVEDILQSTSKNCYVELSEFAIKRIFG